MKVEWVSGNQVFEKINAQQEIEMLEAALAKRPDNHTVLKQLLGLLSYQNEHEKGNELAEKFLRDNPEDQYALALYSNLLKRQKKYSKVFPILQKRLELGYRTNELFGLLAFCHIKVGNRKESLEFVEKVMALEAPGYLTVLYVLETLLDLEMEDVVIKYFKEQQQKHQMTSMAQSLYLRAKARITSKEVLQREVDYNEYIKEIDFNKVYGRDEMKRVREELLDFAKNHHRLQYNPPFISTTKGYQAHIGDASNPVTQQLTNKFKQQVDQYLEESFARFVCAHQRKVRLKPWVVILNKGGYQKPHVHPAGIVSGVFYLQIPDHIANSPKPSEGWIEFGISPEDRGNDPKYAVRPEEGKLLLFPSYLAHRTIPLEKDCSRICFAFDVVPEYE